MSDLPEPWTTWATRAGVRPSMTGIGEKAGVPASTISRLLKGRTTPTTVKAVADALRVGEREVLAAATGESLGPWEPPLSAHLLDAQEREALTLLIQRLTVHRGGSGDAGDSSPKKSDTPDNVRSTPDNVRSMADLKRARFDAAALPVEEAADSPPPARAGGQYGKIKKARDEYDGVGEESQDDGGVDPA